MSRTSKWEHKTDGWHVWKRLERKARPAGRLKKVVQQEREADNDDSDE